jgi:uncharacterized protein (TIGR03000 family)
MRRAMLTGAVSVVAVLFVAGGAARAEDADKAMLDVRVPEYADVWVMGEKTKQLGNEREFITPELLADRTYDYDIRARWIDSDGRTHDQTRSVPVRAGERVVINFFRAPPASQRVVIDRGKPARVERVVEHTSFYRELPVVREEQMISEKAAVIRIKVPPKALVYLSGEQMAQGGVNREFVTRDLEKGKQYTAEVQAKWKENGLEVTQSRKVPLHPGDRITVDFTRPPEKE